MKHSEEYRNFEIAMDAILRADPKAVKAEMEREKQENAEKRKAKKSSASHRAASDKD